jgi:hypothetical protein
VAGDPHPGRHRLYPAETSIPAANKSLLSIGSFLVRNEDRQTDQISHKKLRQAHRLERQKAPVEGDPTGAGDCKREKAIV